MPDSIRDSIRMQTADSQVPSLVIRLQMSGFVVYNRQNLISVCVIGWLGGVVVRASDLWSRDCEFGSSSFHCPLAYANSAFHTSGVGKLSTGLLDGSLVSGGREHCVIRGRGTYTAGMVNSVPLLKVGWKSIYFPSHFWSHDVPKVHQIAQICTYIF